MDSLAQEIGRRVRESRSALGLTLDQLASESGVSRRMIVNVESGVSNASIGTLLRLAAALQVSLSELVAEPRGSERVTVLSREEQTCLWRGDAGGSAVLLASADTPDMLELWAWELGPGDAYSSEAHRAGTFELLHVVSGHLTFTVGDEKVTLRRGDAARVVPEAPHTYANETRRAVRFTLTVLEPHTRHRP